MSTMISTKVTKGGQTTVPKEIRESLGVREGSRVFWSFDGSRATLSAKPTLPNEIFSEEDFWIGIGAAMQDVREGRTLDAPSLATSLREKYGL